MCSKRPQAEAFGIQVGVRGTGVGEQAWHSDLFLTEEHVTIKLHRRKNEAQQSNVVRYCICPIWKPLCICGVCAMRQAVREMKEDRGRVFAGLSPNMITVIKDIANKHGLGLATWHGFRRGRTLDVLQGMDVKANPSASLREIYESGGWKPGSAALFNYIPPKEANQQRCAQQVMDSSDTEEE